MQIIIAVALAIHRLAAADFSRGVEVALDPESVCTAALAYQHRGRAWCSHDACCSGRVAARHSQEARLTATAYTIVLKMAFKRAERVTCGNYESDETPEARVCSEYELAGEELPSTA
jgi:hypothetical protein